MVPERAADELARQAGETGRSSRILASRIPEEWQLYAPDEPPELPELVDAGTGVPILLVTETPKATSRQAGRR